MVFRKKIEDIPEERRHRLLHVLKPRLVLTKNFQANLVICYVVIQLKVISFLQYEPIEFFVLKIVAQFDFESWLSFKNLMQTYIKSLADSWNTI